MVWGWGWLGKDEEEWAVGGGSRTGWEVMPRRCHARLYQLPAELTLGK